MASEELAPAAEPLAAELEQAPVAAEEVSVEAAPEAPSGGEAYPAAEPSAPVMSPDEVSEDGMPVLTAEPEDAEDLAAIAQHEQAPAPAPAEPRAPVEGTSELPYAETTEALAASGTLMQAEPTPEPVPAAEEMPPVAPEAPPAPVPATLSPRAEGRGPTGRIFQQEESVPVLGELAPALALAGASPERPFTVGTGGFSVRVEGEVLTRLDGLVAFTGQVAFTPEMKRFRGRTTDKPFGEGSRRMVRASGRGVLFIEPAERRTFTAVDLGEESAYFRDECVFAFEEPVMFENGRVPSDVAPDLDLVHLRGNGKVLLSLAGPLRSVPVGMDAPVTVPTSHLVGWQGNLTPRVVSLLLGPGGEILKTAVELGGEGFALICLPVR